MGQITMFHVAFFAVHVLLLLGCLFSFKDDWNRVRPFSRPVKQLRLALDFLLLVGVVLKRSGLVVWFFSGLRLASEGMGGGLCRARSAFAYCAFGANAPATRRTRSPQPSLRPLGAGDAGAASVWPLVVGVWHKASLLLPRLSRR